MRFKAAMQISELARQAQTAVDTVRHYEKIGLLPTPTRLGNGYRSYGPAHLQRLRFIRRCRLLDIGLADIARLLSFAAQPQADCCEVDQLIEAQIAQVRERIDHLQTLEQQLRELRQHCPPQVGRTRATADCGILSELQ